MSAKLVDLKAAPKTHWSIQRRFLKYKKILIIPPVLVKNKLKSDSKKKVEIFNSYFAAQCAVVSNTSALPALQLRLNYGLNDLQLVMRTFLQ